MIEGLQPDSPGWRAINRYVEQRVSDLQRQLEGPLDERPTNIIRGKIAALRELAADAEAHRASDTEIEPGPPLY